MQQAMRQVRRVMMAIARGFMAMRTIRMVLMAMSS